MERSGNPSSRGSFIETFNKEVFQDESYRSESKSEEDHNVSDDAFTSNNGSLGHHADMTNSDKRLSEARKIESLSRRETSSMRVWRVMLFLFILVTCAAVTSVIYIVLDRADTRDAALSYKVFTRTVTDASNRKIQEFQLSTINMAQTVTAASAASGDTFPFVTVPMFEVPGSQARELSGVELIIWAPFVKEEQRDQWESYVHANVGWYNDSKEFALSSSSNEYSNPSYFDSNSTIREFLWRFPANATSPYAYEKSPPGGLFAPTWQHSPPPFSAASFNFDILSRSAASEALPAVKQSRDGVLTSAGLFLSRMSGLVMSVEFHEASHNQYLTTPVDGLKAYEHPHSMHVQPVFAKLNDRNSEMVGILMSLVPWDRYLANLLPEGVKGITAVLKNTCNQSYTYVLDGHRADYIGADDLHDTAYDDTKVEVPLDGYKFNETKGFPGHCVYSFALYYSDTFSYDHTTNLPIICATVIAVVFVLMAGTFCMYDSFVRRRNMKLVSTAARSNAIISSLFPTQVRDRLFAEKDEIDGRGSASAAPKSKLKSMMSTGNFMEGNDDEDGDNDFMYKTKPIADLFPETTILFADISGFTAWSSVREPSQVFILLETLYGAFDDIAKKRRVFKVETIGDCYVAVTGLPDPRKDHAVAMARFAHDCMIRMRTLAKKLEVTLGPDTGDLAMRMGMHSGPVTAGVLRGERSRFQLFGDTMNTAARMEQGGVRDKIQMSQETADLLIAAGKTSWVLQREDLVHAKGKGDMQTYWLELSSRGDASSVVDTTSSSVSSENAGGDGVRADCTQADESMDDAKTIRLIEWNTDVLLRLLKQIVARRRACPLPAAESIAPNEARYLSKTSAHALDEVKEIITLPKFKEAKYQEDPENISLDPLVVQQLHDFVSSIAAIYRDNPFHNFEHASHVTMSVVKLLSRIVAPSDLDDQEDSSQSKNIASTLHDHTYGITSDPLTQFSCVLSALIHDADHPGVPNAQLVKEQADIARQYRNKSVGEQNSVDLAWNLLMDPEYSMLRRAIYETDGELKRFRRLVVNSVMATDIVDKELKTLRNLRWDRAFASHDTHALDTRATVNRKATIVIEHLIQASDVAHTMQHWHIYRKWNERFFVECYQAYLDGRAEKNPADGWYEGEIGFLDFYIIPLAKKLKDCGVFGVSSDEYLNYALKNRQEWEANGREVVKEMVELVVKMQHEDGGGPNVGVVRPVVTDGTSARCEV